MILADEAVGRGVDEQRRRTERLRRRRVVASSPRIEPIAGGTRAARRVRRVARRSTASRPRSRARAVSAGCRFDRPRRPRRSRTRRRLRVPQRRGRRAAGCRIPGSSSTRRRIRSGCAAASSSMSRPPNEWPTQSACSMPSASTVSIRSATCGREVPRRLVVGSAVPAQVGCDDVKPRRPPLAPRGA